ncbi:MAG: class I SAM-dependent methyltransferase [Ignavibacteriae bacterium]|nr:class I SAM-dependent methyltransferase [Ignavibacteriota bacterium]
MKNYLKSKFDASNKTVVSVVDELPLWSAPFGQTLFETVNLRPSMKVLDIACGTGFPLIELAGRLGSSSLVYGIDPWKTATDRIKLKLKTYGIRNVKVINCIAEKLPFKNNYFDLIVSNNGINNVPDIKSVLSQCRRVIKPGGQFVFTFNLPKTMSEFYDIFKDVLGELRLIKEIHKLEEHIYDKRKPVSVMDKMLAEADFLNVKKVRNSFSMRYLNGTAFFNHYPVKLHFLPEWKKILPGNRLEEIFNNLENRLNKISEEKGELQLTIPYICYNIKA